MFYRYCRFFAKHLETADSTNSLHKLDPVRFRSKNDIVFEHYNPQTGQKQEEVFQFPLEPFEMEFFANDPDRRFQMFVYPVLDRGCLAGLVLISNPYAFESADNAANRMNDTIDREVVKNYRLDPEHFAFDDKVESTPENLLAARAHSRVF